MPTSCCACLHPRAHRPLTFWCSFNAELPGLQVAVSCEISQGNSIGSRLYVSFAAANAKGRPSKKSRFEASAPAGATVQPKFNASCSNVDVPADTWALLSSPCSWHNCGVYCAGGVPANYEALSLPSIHGVDGAQPLPSLCLAAHFAPPGAALAVVDMCLLWNSTRFVLEPEGEGNNMPPLQVVFSGHGAAAAAAAASCAAFTLWACASIGTTIHTHTLLTGHCPPLPRSLLDYLRADGASNLAFRIADAPLKAAADCPSLGELQPCHSSIEVDPSTLRARPLAEAAAADGGARHGKGDSSGSCEGSDLLRNCLARCCMQRQRGYE